MTSARRRRAFTLIELLVVIAIIGLLVALLDPGRAAGAGVVASRPVPGQPPPARDRPQQLPGGGRGLPVRGRGRRRRGDRDLHLGVQPPILDALAVAPLHRAGRAVQLAQLQRAAVLPRRQRRPGPRGRPGAELHRRGGLGRRVPLPVGLQPDALVALGPGELPVVQRVDVVGPGGRRDVRPVDADRAGERPRRPVEHGRHERAAPRPRRLRERGRDLGPVPPGRALDRGGLHRVVREPCPTPRRSPCRSTTRTRPRA